MRHFRFSLLVSLICLILAGVWGYQHHGAQGALAALGVASILAVLEVSLSFDNAVVNASVLRNWDRFWQNLFLTVGMLIAVFGMRFLFPLIIVALAADLGLAQVWELALNDPRMFSTHLVRHHAEISAFGGVFLLLVFLSFLFDKDKEHHWLGNVEKKIASFGRIASLPVLITLCTLLASMQLLPSAERLPVIISGLWGVIIFVTVDLISNLLEKEEVSDVNLGKVVARGGIGGFLYLEVLDASFSFDGVVGAFAITTDIVVIMLGLAIGAMFVRSMTVYLVHQGTLEQYIFLEHGAHYAIGILAGIMFVSMKYEVSEIFTGLVGVIFILASIWSSIRHRRTSSKQT